MSKRIRKVADVVDEIIELRKKRDEILARLSELEGHPMPQTSSSIPRDFDYKEAIMRIFSEKPNASLSIDDLVARIASKYDFAPERTTVAIRVGYLADSTKPKKLERARRGYYRLPTTHTINVSDTVHVGG